jgi:hypothetical protein
MHDLTVEEHSLGSNPGAKDLARHLFTRMSCGRAVIVADRPDVMHASLRKQWLKLARKVRKERSSTLNAARVLRLSEMIAHMQSMQFTINPVDNYQADVFIVTAAQIFTRLPDCRTAYITGDLSHEQLRFIATRMPKNGLVVKSRFI